jgi:hypothetical protein
MSGTQQSPISDWQPPLPGGQPALPGTPFAAAGYGPARVRKARRRKTLLAIGVAAVVVVAGLVAGVVLGKPKGSLVLPDRLLGLPKATSAGAGQLAHKLRTQEQAGARGRLAGVVAGVYGSPGGWLAIAGGGICGSCSAKSAAVLRGNLTAHGYSDASSFPAGPKGGVLACGSRITQGSTVIRCTWVDGGTAGDVLFSAGSASGLADAAAKTNQVRTATEH